MRQEIDELIDRQTSLNHSHSSAAESSHGLEHTVSLPARTVKPPTNTTQVIDTDSAIQQTAAERRTTGKGLIEGVGSGGSVIFVNENENENGEKRENNEFVNEN